MFTYLLKRFAILVSVIVFLISLSFIVFLIWTQSVDIQDANTHTDATVVLTGGSNRVQTGFKLLLEEKTDFLLISGVHTKTTLSDAQKSALMEHCCISLDYAAVSTKENAKQTGLWMSHNGFKTLRIVTSDYHMPRAMQNYLRAMPDIELFSYPVRAKNLAVDTKNFWQLAIEEYMKFIFGFINGNSKNSD